MRKKQQTVKRPPLWIVIVNILSVFVGLLTAVIGITKIVNYYHPYWFGLIFGSIGLVLGIMTALKLKPYITVYQKVKNEFGLVVMYISTGFIGIILLTGSIINKGLSNVENRDNYAVINKYRQEGRARSPEINSLFVNINRNSHRLICRHDYWDKIQTGQSIDLTLYKSKLGFDFIEISDENKASR